MADKPTPASAVTAGKPTVPATESTAVPAAPHTLNAANVDDDAKAERLKKFTGDPSATPRAAGQATVPGGQYVVNGKLVNSAGQEIAGDDAGKDESAEK